MLDYLLCSSSGAQAGTVLAMPVTGALAESAGWEAPFYLFGALGLAWVVAWFFFGADSPSTHRTISKAERDYIETSLNVLDKPKVSLATLSHS